MAWPPNDLLGAVPVGPEMRNALARAVMINPVGTEVAPLPGQQSVGMPGDYFDPLVAMGSNGQPITASAVGAARALREQGQGVAMNTVLGMTGNAPRPGFRAYHGSPHDFPPTPRNPLGEFDPSKIGTGEGAQAYGHGLYVAGNEGVARGYRDALATTKTPEEAAAAYLHELGGDRNAAISLMTDHAQGGLGATAEEAANLRGGLQLLKSGADIQPKAPGHMYEVQVNADPAHFLDWDRPLSEQSPLVQDKIRNLQSRKMLPQGWTAEDMATLKGRDLLQELRHASGSEAKSAVLLAEAVPGAGQGIPGIRYLDAGSRGVGEGTSNHVIFDAQTLEILRKYGIAGLMAGGATAAGASQQ